MLVMLVGVVAHQVARWRLAARAHDMSMRGVPTLVREVESRGVVLDALGKVPSARAASLGREPEVRVDDLLVRARLGGGCFRLEHSQLQVSASHHCANAR